MCMVSNDSAEVTYSFVWPQKDSTEVNDDQSKYIVMKLELQLRCMCMI